jgi:hypothetical protein
MNKAELQAALRDIEAAEEAERARVRAATPIIMKFTITPTTARGWTEVYDDTCKLYDLEGTVTNAAEAKAAGRAGHELTSGGITYAFNTGTGLLVCAIGGGTIWIGAGMDEQKRESARATMAHISKFLVEHPEGGDITDIVEAHRNGKNA